MDNAFEDVLNEVIRGEFKQLIVAEIAERLARDIDEETIKSIVRSGLRRAFMGQALSLVEKSRKLQRLAALREV